MDAQTCLKKMQEAGVLAMATVDEHGAPQIRSVSAIHYDKGGFHFFTARGKEMSKQLLSDGRIQTLVNTRLNEMIRLSGKAAPVCEERQKKCIDTIFDEYKFLSELYPNATRYVGIVFEVKNATIEYFNLDARPIFREVYTLGNANILTKGYVITNKCIACGKCATVCPQHCIEVGTPYKIEQNNCLHCGNCFENCPTDAIEKK